MHNAKKSQTFTKAFKHDFPLHGVHLFFSKPSWKKKIYFDDTMLVDKYRNDRTFG